MAEQVPSVGRIVHYVSGSGAHRPAIIIDAHSYDDTVSLFAFLMPAEGSTLWHVQCKHDEELKDHDTWHWPEYVAPI